ncbi:hypothetical protein [Paenibacillus lentus]|uniref:Uncharacterized protein n=1 Tax=Paenibacillus lentus TaxID=1338368 RepID=A0A3S8RXH6_9BACL|nr:hypothetical protein [Paenibacillus lentus]AZK47500.1 hypothetical protein EIM92_16195 [Paenibacillus lentus]
MYEIGRRGVTIYIALGWFVIIGNRMEIDSKFRCPNQSTESQRKIKDMKSYTLLTVAMMVYDQPFEENIILQKYVDQYVSMFKI